jgi:hypothetical protein
MVTVEFVYSRDCPNAEEARGNLRRALTEAGLVAEWSEWEASSDATPTHLRNYGSPTVVVNGRDVAGAGAGDASSCRVYEVAGTRSGVPPAELIVRALVAAEQPKRAGGWRRALLVLPAIGAALVPGLTCPACWPGYAALLSALGVGFIPTAPYLLPLTVAFLIVALVGLTFRATTRIPLAVGVAGSMLVLIGKFLLASNPVTYTGAGLLLTASLYTARARRAAPCSACAPEQSTTRKGVKPLMAKSISLCPGCDACPSVEIDEHEVRIGEAGNLAKLTPAEWNVLVRAIKAGELTEV